MESLTTSIRIPCPIHSKEFIQRVHIDNESEQQLFCVECILKHQDPTSLSPKLIDIPELIETAAHLYEQNRQTIKVSSQPPQDYLDLVSQQAEKLEKLSKHIEQEKKKVSTLFDNILQDIVRKITEKKNECLYNLDQQLCNLQYWYTFFDKQLKKAYPSEKDVYLLYPKREDLNIELGKATNVAQLSAFVRSLKEDIKEQTHGMMSDVPLEKEYKDSLPDLSKNLIEAEGIRPIYKQNIDTSTLKSKLQGQIMPLLSEMHSLQNPISAIVASSNLGSQIINRQEFEMIEGWIPKSIQVKSSLLYRASRDGFTGNAFHKLCDGVKNTITLIKAQFQESSSTCILGGFLDQPWRQDNNYMSSTESFIFNITSKIKCMIEGNGHAGYGGLNQGPSFGGGHDLVVFLAGTNGQCYVNPYSYKEAKRLVDMKDYKSGLVYFTAKEVEVYSLN